MSDLPVVAQILSASVGLMGALVAGLSVYVAYRGRHNQFRQVVYGRQMDAYFGIADAMSGLFTTAQHALAAANPRLRGEDARTRFRTAVRAEHERFTGTVNRSLIVLPSRVKAAVEAFNEAVLAVADPDAATHPTEPGEVLARAYEQAVNCLRHHLAVDSLTTGLLNEMGVGSESVALRTTRHGVNPLVSVRRG